MHLKRHFAKVPGSDNYIYTHILYTHVNEICLNQNRIINGSDIVLSCYRFPMGNESFISSFQNVYNNANTIKPVFLNNNAIQMQASAVTYTANPGPSGDRPFHFDFQEYSPSSTDYTADNNSYGYNMLDSGINENISHVLLGRNSEMQENYPQFQDPLSAKTPKFGQRVGFSLKVNSNSVGIKTKDVLKDKTKLPKEEKSQKVKKVRNSYIFLGTMEAVRLFIMVSYIKGGRQAKGI